MTVASSQRRRASRSTGRHRWTTWGSLATGFIATGSPAGSSTPTSATISGLVCGRSYQLAVDARDAAGNRSARAGIVASTSPCSDTQPPSVPPALAQAGATETTAWINWGASTDNVGVAGYGVYVGQRCDGSRRSRATRSPGSPAARATRWRRRLRRGGEPSDRAQRPARGDEPRVRATRASVAPSGLATSAVTTSTVTLSWNASSDNVAVTGYGRYRDGALVSSGPARATCLPASPAERATRLASTRTTLRATAPRSASTSATTSACPLRLGGGGSASVYLSPAGSDSNACTQAAPCKGFDRGYRVAAPGGVVEVAAAPTRRRRSRPTARRRSASDVVFRPAGGASVVLGDLTVLADHVEIRDLTVNEQRLDQDQRPTTSRCATSTCSASSSKAPPTSR